MPHLGYPADIFRFLLCSIFGIKRKKKKREKSGKRIVASLSHYAWKTKENRVNTGIKQKNNRKREKEWTDEKDREHDRKTRLETKSAFLIPDLYLEKKKKKKRKKDAGEGKEKGRKKRSGLAIVRRTYRQVSGAERG